MPWCSLEAEPCCPPVTGGWHPRRHPRRSPLLQDRVRLLVPPGEAPRIRHEDASGVGEGHLDDLEVLDSRAPGGAHVGKKVDSIEGGLGRRLRVARWRDRRCGGGIISTGDHSTDDEIGGDDGVEGFRSSVLPGPSLVTFHTLEGELGRS